MSQRLSCAFTGHRPQRFDFGYDEEDDRCIFLKQILNKQMIALINLGVKHFYTGMALGVDQWAALEVLSLKEQFPDITLSAVRPCDTQANKWTPEQRLRYFDIILPRCDEVHLISYNYTKTCMFERNRYMVNNSDFLLAVYDGGVKGGTAYTVKYATEKNKEIIIINPDDFAVTTPPNYRAMQQRTKWRVIQQIPSDAPRPPGSPQSSAGAGQNEDTTE